MGLIALLAAGLGFALGCGLGTLIALRFKMDPLVAFVFILIVSFVTAFVGGGIVGSVMGAST